MTPLDLEAIKSRCAAATPGPAYDGGAAMVAHARSDVPALVAEVERLREWKETHSVSSTLRTRAETAEARVAELERDLADTNRVRADYDHDRREAREALKVAQDRLGELAAAVIAHEDAEFACGMYANIASPKYADLIESRKRLRTLLAKGGAA